LRTTSGAATSWAARHRTVQFSAKGRKCYVREPGVVVDAKSVAEFFDQGVPARRLFVGYVKRGFALLPKREAKMVDNNRVHFVRDDLLKCRPSDLPELTSRLGAEERQIVRSDREPAMLGSEIVEAAECGAKTLEHVPPNVPSSAASAHARNAKVIVTSGGPKSAAAPKLAVR
jgi:hypothetical protein